MRTFEQGSDRSKGKLRRKKKDSNLAKLQRYVASMNDEQISRMIEDSTKSFTNGQDVTGKNIYTNTIQQESRIRPKLEISQPEDQSEKQADKVAEGVTKGDVNISRMALDQTPSDINTKNEDAGMSTTPGFDQQLQSTKGQGSKLEGTVQREMESHLGSDLSGVNIHTGGDAQQMSGDINAKAFAHEQDVYFNEGQYNPSSEQGKGLLAHELTHTVQQSEGKVQTKIQRKKNPHAPENLESEWFSGIKELEDALDGTIPFGLEAAGLFVKRIQEALVTDLIKFWLGRNADNSSWLIDLGPEGVDGIYGKNTKKSIYQFQLKCKTDYKGWQSTPDGIVGSETMWVLDALLKGMPYQTQEQKQKSDDDFAKKLINNALRKKKPDDPDVVTKFWAWYDAEKVKPSLAEIADMVNRLDFSYLDTDSSRLLMFGMTSAAATMLSRVGADKDPDFMQKLINMTEAEKQKAFLRSTEETMAILLMEYGTGKGKETRYFNTDHPFTKDIMTSGTTAHAYKQFYDEIRTGEVEDGETKYYVQGYHNRSKSWIDTIRIHLQSIMHEQWGEFFRGGMEYWMTIKGDNIIVTAKDKYTEDSGIRNGTSRPRIPGIETPLGTTYVILKWTIPIKGTLLDYKGLEYYQKNKKK
jgi:peptidoglycan hydrolase-like protein with peptidoglycan-binding domain